MNNNLSDFLSFESKHGRPSSTITISHDAIDQLLESKLGNELTRCAAKLEQQTIRTTTTTNTNTNNQDENQMLLEETVAKLMDTVAFQQMNVQIQECPLLSSLLLPSSSTTTQTVGKRETDDKHRSNKKSREESPSATATDNKPPAAPAAAVATTSFSLFDLMDSQKGTFTIPPRITAQQIIEADQRHNNTITMNNNNNSNTVSFSNDNTNDSTTTQMATTTKSNNNKSALELLEQAQDMEDLSPDVESWEVILSILYRGMITTTNNNNNNTTKNTTKKKKVEEDRRRRYFNVHKSLFDKCQRNNGGGVGGGGMFRSQCWGLTYNIVGLILSLSKNEFVKQRNNNNNNEQEEEIVVVDDDLDLYWDSCHHLLQSLSQLAIEYCTSSIGYEREMERMMLGLCSILCTDVASCVLAMMEPMAGWLEVWSRFVVGPKRLMAILRVSGLGEVVLRRCESRGRNEASKRLYGMLSRRDGSSDVSPTLEDIEESIFLQSLSILRVIVSRCDATLGSMCSIFSRNTSSSSFLTADGIITSDEVQAMLETKEQSSSIEEQDEITKRVLQPFRDVLLLKEPTPDLVDADLEELCTQTVSLLEQRG